MSMMQIPVVAKTDLDLPCFTKGKVRDVYDLGERLLIISTDRISAYDYILPTPIPGKGCVLNDLSVFWFKKTKIIVPNHLITDNWREYPPEVVPFKTQIEGRSMLVRKTKKINIECVVRGYLVGSGWKEYQENGGVCGIRLPQGLKECDKLIEPIFTPATKEEMGTHDRNISEQEMAGILGAKLTEKLKKFSLKLYAEALVFAESKGIIIADTKFEFGLLGDQVILIDEVLTPDSSRFWDVKKYTPGKSQDSFDKQFVRDYLDSIKWNRQPPVPVLPDGIVSKTQEKYQLASRRLMGKDIG